MKKEWKILRKLNCADTVTKATAIISSTKDDSARTVKIVKTILEASAIYSMTVSQEWRYKARSEIQMRRVYVDNKQYASITVRTIEFVFIIVRGGEARGRA